MHSSAAEVYERHQRMGVVEAKRTTRDRSDLPVEPFGPGVCESSPNVRKHSVEVCLDRVRCSREVTKPGRPRLYDPLLQPPSTHVHLSAVEDVDERLLCSAPN